MATLCSNMFLFFFISHLIHEFLFFGAGVHSEFYHCFTLNFGVARQWSEIFSDRFSSRCSFSFEFVDRFMIFPSLIAIQACKIALEAIAPALALMSVRIMLFMCMFACARWSPLMNIKPFSSWHPPLADFFWSSWDEGEPFADALLATRLR